MLESKFSFFPDFIARKTLVQTVPPDSSANEANNTGALFTITSLLSLQGSATAATLVPNVFMYLLGDSFKPKAKWVSFLIAMALQFLVAYLVPKHDIVTWIIAFFNGLLVFASAVGINQGISSMGPPPSRSSDKPFFRSWF